MQNPTIPTPRPQAMLLATGLTIALVVLTDRLLFDVAAGINLFVVVLAIGLAILGVAWRRGRQRQGALGLVVVVVLALPLAEAPSLTGVGLSMLGLGVAALMAVRLLPDRLERVPATLLRFMLPAPATLARDAVRLGPVLRQRLGRRTAPWLIAWIVPLGLGAVFAYLFAAANPLIETMLSGVRLDSALSLLNPLRLLFWLIMAMGLWALLRPRLLRRLRRIAPAMAAPLPESLWLGTTAVLRSLLVFNALFAIETALDLTYLWGGVELPGGMSHADYAHRGAYPLIVTALLAGAFVLAAMREQGAARDNRAIRILIYLFIAQNVLLCLSAMLRLELYVEAYSLTELRLAAGIWMGLVAVGLVLVLLRIWWRKSNGWLIATNLLALVSVFYGTAMLDLNGQIARFNVEHSLDVSKQGLPIDIDYLASLGTSAIPAFDRLIPRLAVGSDRWSAAVEYRADLAGMAERGGLDWRSWNWRAARLDHYLAMHAVASAPPNRQNGRMVTRGPA
ncbi:DUF4173 domain-containing protein [Devosia sp. FKR38]|uniref:DUF4153 domain-containing protein n=1 Tax=Devosia sp. FKR38 TaxID=2562312 RepID=UPI0010C07DDD|nr:DUF4173 domain-containing protein [Devosia sp. FKR38]